jgi:hypothetical protein
MNVIRQASKHPILLTIVILSLVVSIVEAWWTSTTAWELDTGIAFAAALLFHLLAILILFGVSVVKKDVRCLLGALVVPAGFIGAHTVSSSMQQALHKQTEADGLRLHQAITAYQKDNNRLPIWMTDLVPQYISAVPEPAFRRSKYSFHRDKEKTTVTLYYTAPSALICELLPSGTWMCHD